MSDEITELARRLIIGHKRDERSIYDAQAKHELILVLKSSNSGSGNNLGECLQECCDCNASSGERNRGNRWAKCSPKRPSSISTRASST